MSGCRDDSAPDVSLLQDAYERESAAGSSLHDAGLRLVEAKCDNGATGRYLCQVSFVSAGDPDQQLYFDIIAVARRKEGWVLQSGLCKR